MNRVYRDVNNKIIGGVCAGLANHLNIDPVIIRLAWVFAVIFGGFGFLAYIICWIIFPPNY